MANCVNTFYPTAAASSSSDGFVWPLMSSCSFSQTFFSAYPRHSSWILENSTVQSKDSKGLNINVPKSNVVVGQSVHSPVWPSKWGTLY